MCSVTDYCYAEQMVYNFLRVFFAWPVPILYVLFRAVEIGFKNLRGMFFYIFTKKN